MHSFVAYTLLASATLSVALDPRFEFPDTVPLMKRQQPGTPQYACHEDCGLLITLGREDGYCDNDEWNERYGRCMTCANTYNIWQYYRNGVTSAAKECDLSPTPKPSGSGAASTTAEDKPSSTAVKEPATTEAEEPETTAAEESATDVAEESATAAPEKTTTAEDTAEATSTSAESESEETKGPDSETTEASEPSETAKPTTLTTQPAATTEAANPTETDAGSGAGHSSVDEIGTIGVTATPTPAPSGVVVSGATKQFGFSTAMVVVALAMFGLY
ncbi:hypothetical protein FSARC_13579 [Fusarium sarcochroum]|uniref:Uncharacterized protein n=1 Tax=Fusarium sarcochroum TaxID=1208366 RepID=A0A8H4WT83_9HYPO|nr:hypothetical protein FSARC_13579 [Fusarium sarcochroum]